MAISEFQPHVRTVLASFLFVDVVGFSKVSAAEQHAFKVALISVLQRALAIFHPQDYRLRDTGDGALISFLANPEHALYTALAIAQDCGQMAEGAVLTLKNLRTGMNLGTVKESMDVESRPNFVGDGINAAQRIMDFAQPGQVTASRSFMEAVGPLDAVYAALFVHLGARADKHGRQHELFAVTPSGGVLAQMRRGLAAPEPVAAAPLAPPEPVAPPVLTVPPLPPLPSLPPSAPLAAAPTPTAVLAPSSTRAYVLWGLVAAAVVVGAVWGIRSFGGGQAAAVPAPVVVVLPDPAAGATSVPPSAVAATPPAPVAATVTPGPASEAPPARPVASSVKAARPLAHATEPLPRAPRAVESTPNAAPAAPATDRSSSRCSRIMQKASVGEPLSSEEKRELANSC